MTNPNTNKFYRKLTELYQRQSDAGQPVAFVTAGQLGLPDNMTLHQVMTIRHGDPLIKKKGWTGFRGARQWAKGYDTVDVEDFADFPVHILPGQVDRIYSSNIPRARATAKRIFGSGFEIMESGDYREFERLVPAIPLIRLPLKWWLVLARIPWAIGWPGIESLRKARQRSKAVAEFLHKEGAKKGRVVLVAHGFLNRLVHRRLRRHGWRQVRHKGHGFLAVSVFALIGEKG